MPRMTDRKVSSREKPGYYDINARTTPELNTPARPTDPYAAPVKDTKSLATIEALKGLGSSVTSFATDFQTYREKRRSQNSQQGKMDAEVGKYNKPNSLLNFGEGYDEAFDVTKGEALGAKVRQDYIESLLQNNAFVDSPDPVADKNKLFRDTYSKYFSPEDEQNFYLKFGASTAIHNAQLEADLQFRKIHWDEKQKQLANSIYTTQKDVVQRAVFANMTDAKAIKSSLFATSQVAKEAGMSTEDFSHVTLNAFGDTLKEIANNKAIPVSEAFSMIENLRSVFKEPDRGGQSWYTILGADKKPIYQNTIDSINSDVNTILKGRSEVSKKEQEDAADQKLGDYHLAVSELDYNDTGAALALYKQFEADRGVYKFKPGDVSGVGKALQEIIQGQGFAKVSDRKLTTVYDTDMMKGSLSPRKILENVKDLSKEDFRYYMSEAKQQEEKRRNGSDKDWLTHTKMMGEAYDGAIKAITPKNSFGMLVPNAKTEQAGSELRNLVQAFKRRNNREPEMDEMNGIVKKWHESYPAFDMTNPESYSAGTPVKSAPTTKRTVTVSASELK
jgi:hypothetical protein